MELFKTKNFKIKDTLSIISSVLRLKSIKKVNAISDYEEVVQLKDDKVLPISKVAKELGYSYYVFKEKLTSGSLPDLKYTTIRKNNSNKVKYIFKESDIEEYIKLHPVTDRMVQVKVAAKALGYKTYKFRKMLKKGLVSGLKYSIVDRGGAKEYIILESDINAYLILINN